MRGPPFDGEDAEIFCAGGTRAWVGLVVVSLRDCCWKVLRGGGRRRRVFDARRRPRGFRWAIALLLLSLRVGMYDAQ